MNRLATRHCNHRFTTNHHNLEQSFRRRRCLFMLGYQRFQAQGHLDTKAFDAQRVQAVSSHH